ncbi:MAG: aromatic hydrocarbon degradation protein [Sulfurimonas sp.]|nr:aromatic hydrocarbon degradation protein [Sulfurimonas sp.]MBU3940193.1 outer membrane protein transport protein [bacterium]MBU4024728.1 outer membrane protein transport protein [bacterium]MBU4058600.1 outer membrane protein transport protein [bacterium]MBU4110856.1 outer membrane protein transport protein [bacterium]
MKKIALMSLVASSVLLAGGYKIPETSLNSVALSAANIAHNKSADAAYYNPANMVFMADENAMEADLMYIKLDATNYQGTVSGTGPYDIDAETENFLVPAIHYVSGKVNGGARFGLSVVSPGGLSKRWEEQPAKTSAEEFTLQTVEVNPTVALPIGDKIGVAVGLRIVHSKGVVKSDGIAPIDGLGYSSLARDMEGDSIDFGYNIALAYKPTSELGLTYRSKVDLTVEGNAKLDLTTNLTTTPSVRPSYDGSATVSVPLPATLSLAAAYTFPTKTIVEFVYERSYWSAYQELDFDYQGSIDPYVNAVFGTSINKDWKDTNAFRLGITQELDALTLMAGVVYGESPIPDETLSFELPDSDSTSVSIGGRYAINEKVDVGLAILYSMRESRSISAADNENDLDGEFTNSNVLLVSAGVGYKF